MILNFGFTSRAEHYRRLFVARVTRRMSRVEQELNTLPEHLSSSPVFSVVRVPRSFFFCITSCRSLFVLLSVLLLTIILSVLLWFTAFEYHVDNFKHFLFFKKYEYRLYVNLFNSTNIWRYIYCKITTVKIYIIVKYKLHMKCTDVF